MDWKFVDNVLEKYRQEYSAKQNDLKDELENQLIKYGKIKELYAIATETDISQYKRFLERNEEYIKNNGYCAYMVGKTKNKTKLKYKEILDTIVLVLYAKFQKEIYQKQFDTLSVIGSNVYSSTIRECEKLGHKPTRKIPLLDDLLILLLLMPNEKGITYQEQNDAETIYNAEQISKQVTVDIMANQEPDIRDDRYTILFDRQKRREINKKKDQKQQDKYSGIIDDESTFIINQIKVQMYKIYDFKYCEFVGIEDDRQTLMCKSLSGQMFNLTELNVYSRYSGLDKKDVVYHTVGMVVGENLPPITNHKHACRSYIKAVESVTEIANENKELKNTLNELHSKGKKDNVEYMAVIKDNKIVGELNTLNNSNKVKLNDKQIKEIGGNPKEEYYVAHNHLTNHPIEPFDLQVMDEYKNVKGVIVTTDSRDYIFIRNDNMENIFGGIDEYMYNNIDNLKNTYPKLNNIELQFVGLVNGFKSMGGKIIYLEKA